MKKMLMIALAMAGQIFAAEAPEKEPFLGTDLETYYLSHEPQIVDNVEYLGKFSIQNEAGEELAKISGGRISLGTQPWPVEAGSVDENRLNIFTNVYEWLIELENITPVYEEADRGTVKLRRLADVHAATVWIPETVNDAFKTVAIQEAILSFIQKNTINVAPDNTAPEQPAGYPLFIISPLKFAPVLPENSTSRIFELPYYPGKAGIRYTIITRMNGQPLPDLPELIQAQLQEYINSLA